MIVWGKAFHIDIALYMTIFFIALDLGMGTVKRSITTCLVE